MERRRPMVTGSTAPPKSPLLSRTRDKTSDGGGAADGADGVGSGAKKFAQLDQMLPTPNVYRTASGAPGNAYWQQQADYIIRATLDENERTITGTEKITYSNNSPDSLKYLWLQLDQNQFRRDSISQLSSTTSNLRDRLSFKDLSAAHGVKDTEYGHMGM